jgi:hypothetical protein
MTSVPGKPARKKTKRVATVFTGLAAMGAAFGPAAQAAQAAPPPPLNPTVPQPYTIWVKTSALVYWIQVCAYKNVGTKTLPAGSWYCTGVERNPHYLSNSLEPHSNYFGPNWVDGKVNVWVWSIGKAEWGHTCNTHADSYHGVLRNGVNSDSAGVSLSAGYHNPITLNAYSEC